MDKLPPEMRRAAQTSTRWRERDRRRAEEAALITAPSRAGAPSRATIRPRHGAQPHLTRHAATPPHPRREACERIRTHLEQGAPWDRLRRVPRSRRAAIPAMPSCSTGVRSRTRAPARRSEAHALLDRAQPLVADDPGLLTEILSLRGRLWKDRLHRAQDATARANGRSRARDEYLAAYALQRAPYPGINAATLSLLLGETRRRAGSRARDRCGDSPRRRRRSRAGITRHWAKRRSCSATSTVRATAMRPRTRAPRPTPAASRRCAVRCACSRASVPEAADDPRRPSRAHGDGVRRPHGRCARPIDATVSRRARTGGRRGDSRSSCPDASTRSSTRPRRAAPI